MKSLPIIGAKRHELPMSGSSLGPGISKYDFACGLLDIGPFDDCWLAANADGSMVVETSFGNILIADENAVRLTSALAADLVPILCCVACWNEGESNIN